MITTKETAAAAISKGRGKVVLASLDRVHGDHWRQLAKDRHARIVAERQHSAADSRRHQLDHRGWDGAPEARAQNGKPDLPEKDYQRRIVMQHPEKRPRHQGHPTRRDN